MPSDILPGSEKFFGTRGYSLTHVQYEYFKNHGNAPHFSVEDRTQTTPHTPYHVSTLYSEFTLLRDITIEAMLHELNTLVMKHKITEMRRLETCAKQIAADDKDYGAKTRLIISLQAAITAIRNPTEENTAALLANSKDATTHGAANPRLRNLGLCLAALGVALIAIFGVMLAFSLLPLPSAVVTFAVGMSGIAAGTGLFLTGMRLFEKNRQQGLSSRLVDLTQRLPKIQARRSRNLAVLGNSG